jgi:methionyl aminopeptidase
MNATTEELTKEGLVPNGTADHDDEKDDSGDDKEEEIGNLAEVASSITKKKKKKRKKKKSSSSTSAAEELKEGEPRRATTSREPSKKPPHLGLKDTAFVDYFVKFGQTDPPTIPVIDLFSDIEKDLPTGEILSHPNQSQSYRESSAEIRSREHLQEDLYRKVRLGAEIHRQVRAYAQSIMKPGILLADMCEKLENKNRELVQEQGIARGIGFPTGCSLNYVAAHYTPNSGDDTVLKYDDVMKVTHS